MIKPDSVSVLRILEVAIDVMTEKVKFRCNPLDNVHE